MKWKCFRRILNYRLENNQSGRIDNYKDPVLIAYWNALHDDILCAWRRVPTEDGQKIERELWLFGINEDLPSDLPYLRRNKIDHSEDFLLKISVFFIAMPQSNGSWNDTAMSYDCRIMLFKALHNMIEK